MALFTVKAPANIRELDAGKMHAHLTAQGLDVEGVSVKYDNADDVFTYYIECGTDPSDVVKSYVKQPTAQELARLQVKGVRDRLLAGTATPTELREAVAALITLIGE